MKVLDRLSAENARTYALRVLQYNIINLELVPGSTVSENELSAILNLSRTPVREALIELSKVGLVEIQPQRGSYIAKIDYELIEESRFMRLVLENAVLKLACEGISQEYMDKLKENLRMEDNILKKRTQNGSLSWTTSSTNFSSIPLTRHALMKLFVLRWFTSTVSGLFR